MVNHNCSPPFGEYSLLFPSIKQENLSYWLSKIPNHDGERFGAAAKVSRSRQFGKHMFSFNRVFQGILPCYKHNPIFLSLLFLFQCLFGTNRVNTEDFDKVSAFLHWSRSNEWQCCWRDKSTGVVSWYVVLLHDQIISNGWSTYPPLGNLTPPEIRSSIAGLIKGNLMVNKPFIEQWAMEKGPQVVSCVYRGWNTTQLYRVYNKPLLLDPY